MQKKKKTPEELQDCTLVQLQQIASDLQITILTKKGTPKKFPKKAELIQKIQEMYLKDADQNEASLYQTALEEDLQVTESDTDDNTSNRPTSQTINRVDETNDNNNETYSSEENLVSVSSQNSEQPRPAIEKTAKTVSSKKVHFMTKGTNKKQTRPKPKDNEIYQQQDQDNAAYDNNYNYYHHMDNNYYAYHHTPFNQGYYYDYNYHNGYYNQPHHHYSNYNSYPTSNDLHVHQQQSQNQEQLRGRSKEPSPNSNSRHRKITLSKSKSSRNKLLTSSDSDDSTSSTSSSDSSYTLMQVTLMTEISTTTLILKR